MFRSVYIAIRLHSKKERQQNVGRMTLVICSYFVWYYIHLVIYTVISIMTYCNYAQNVYKSKKTSPAPKQKKRQEKKKKWQTKKKKILLWL